MNDNYKSQSNKEIERIINQELEKAKMELILRDKMDIFNIIQNMKDNEELEILKQKLKKRKSKYFK